MAVFGVEVVSGLGKARTELPRKKKNPSVGVIDALRLIFFLEPLVSSCKIVFNGPRVTVPLRISAMVLGSRNTCVDHVEHRFLLKLAPITYVEEREQARRGETEFLLLTGCFRKTQIPPLNVGVVSIDLEPQGLTGDALEGVCSSQEV